MDINQRWKSARAFVLCVCVCVRVRARVLVSFATAKWRIFSLHTHKHMRARVRRHTHAQTHTHNSFVASGRGTHAHTHAPLLWLCPLQRPSSRRLSSLSILPKFGVWVSTTGTMCVCVHNAKYSHVIHIRTLTYRFRFGQFGHVLISVLRRLGTSLLLASTRLSHESVSASASASACERVSV